MLCLHDLHHYLDSVLFLFCYLDSKKLVYGKYNVCLLYYHCLGIVHWESLPLGLFVWGKN